MLKDLLISEANEIDAKFLWELRNEYPIRLMSKSTEFIDWETHKEWFLNTLKNDDSNIYIAFFKNEPVAMVRYELSKKFKKSFEISIAVKTKFQGIGIAKKLLQESMKLLAEKVNKDCKIISIVKKINSRSIRFFENYGFVLINQSKELFYYSLKI